MFRFGRIFDQVTETERRKMAEVQAIFRQTFPVVAEYANRLPEMFSASARLSYDPVLITAEDGRGRVLGFALAHYYPDSHFGYLDYVATLPTKRAAGVGGALYEAVRELLAKKGARGLFMDVPPDDPAAISDPALIPGNQKRLRFYEQYGATPIINTKYETRTPFGTSDLDLPHLVYDPLGKAAPLSRADARKAVLSIMTKKYNYPADDPYVRMVVDSFQDDPVKLRPKRYIDAEHRPPPEHGRIRPLQVVVAEHHEIHHVRERGYVERPARVDAILNGLAGLSMERRNVRRYDERWLRTVHDANFLSYLARVVKTMKPNETLYPYVFPIRRPDRMPKDLAVRAGYFCIDTFTPLSRQAYEAARSAADCALSGADLLLGGHQLVYSLCRPPGHHAERKSFGGFCYFNNSAIAAQKLVSSGKVALLDIDFHHGNGAQDIFYNRSDVFTVSIHGHPNHAYPYFSGFADERGEGEGKGFNRNYPLMLDIGEAEYLRVLKTALDEIRAFKPTWLVVSLGFDIMRGDPTGSFEISLTGMRKVGELIGQIEIPTLFVQEGGYSIRNLRRGAQRFFRGLIRAWYELP